MDWHCVKLGTKIEKENDKLIQSFKGELTDANDNMFDCNFSKFERLIDEIEKFLRGEQCEMELFWDLN